jgi:hypothetical protein
MSDQALNSMSPTIDALHAARSALTVAAGRVALAQRHAVCGDLVEQVGRDLATVPANLAAVADAVDRLAAAAAACEPDSLLALISSRDRSATTSEAPAPSRH